jgi:hypothetical protein
MSDELLMKKQANACFIIRNIGRLEYNNKSSFINHK